MNALKYLTRMHIHIGSWSKALEGLDAVFEVFFYFFDLLWRWLGWKIVDGAAWFFVVIGTVTMGAPRSQEWFSTSSSPF